MADLPWLDRVAYELSRQGLPLGERQKLLSELSDHQQDLEESSMDAQRPEEVLGTPEVLAVVAAKEYRQRSWVGRHRLAAFFVFAVLPVPLLTLSGLVLILSCLTTGEALGFLDPGLKTIRSLLPWALPALSIVFPAAGWVWLYRWYADRTGVSQTWWLISCAMLLVGAGMISCEVTLSDLPGESSIGFSVGKLFAASHFMPLLQILVPLAIGLYVARRDPENSALSASAR